jgi:geranylgeranyl pyrophosphate synthase
MRRAIRIGPSQPSLYAVRQYFESERPLDPVFDFYIPLELGERVLSGYGWVFPIDEHTANVGIGFYRDIFGAHPSLTRVLDAFVEELQTRAARRFGELQPIGDPMGSPLGTRTEPDRLEIGNIVFTGDAAGTTHALSGEGIAFAMRAGEAVAELIHSRSRGPTQHTNGDVEKMLSRRFPQLGIDVSMLTRVWVREIAEGKIESRGSAPRPFLGIVKRLIGESAYGTSIEETGAWKALNASDSVLAKGLSVANDAILDNVAEEFPFTAEVVHLRIRSHLGPMYAAVALACAGRGGASLPPGAVDAAVAAETLGVFPDLLGMLVDRSRSKSSKVNNVFAVLTADFVAARSLMAASKLGSQAVVQLAQTAMQECEGGMRDAEARFAPERTSDSWFRAAAQTAGEAAVFAAHVGAGTNDDVTLALGTLREYGIELGIAMRLAEEITELTEAEVTREGRAGADLRRGIYPLAVLFALEVEPQLARLLAQHLVDDDLFAIVSLVRESGGLDRAISVCLEHTNTAHALAETLPTAQGKPLAMLAAVPADYIAVMPSLA